MKNINEELHRLNRYEYNVSEDFSKRVMKRIQKDKFSIKLKRVIPFASLTVAACLIVMVYTKVGVDDGIKMNAISTNFSSEELEKESSNLDSISSYDEAQVLPNEKSNGMQEMYKVTEDAIQGNERAENIISVLKQVGYQVESIEGGLKIKAAKEEIQDLFEEELDLETQGEWTILKF